MIRSIKIFSGTLFVVLLGVATTAQATIILNTLSESVMVGSGDTNSNVAPLAPGVHEPAAVGNPWFTSSFDGMLRGRATTQFQRRTQWNFRFDASALAGVDAADITAVTLSIPQIGRLNTQSYTNLAMRLYANTYDWADDGSADYPTWNRGRTDAGGDGVTIVGGSNAIGTYNTFGQVTDTSNTNVEGTFIITSTTGNPADGPTTLTTEGVAALLTTVQGWATNPASNEGFLLTYQNADNMGLAFGTPTLTITTIPEPGAASLLVLGGLLLAGRRLRRRA